MTCVTSYPSKAPGRSWSFMARWSTWYQKQFQPWYLCERDFRFSVSNIELYIGLSISDLMLYTVASTSRPTQGVLYVLYATYADLSH